MIQDIHAMQTPKFIHFTDDFPHLNPCGLYLLKKKSAQLEDIMGIARQCEMSQTLKELNVAADILADQIKTLEEAAQVILIQYEREIWPPIGGIEGIDEEVAELVARLADTL